MPAARRTRHAVVAAALLGTALVSCSIDPGRTGDRLLVAAAFYPVEAVVRAVGGDAIDVVTVVPPGEGAHEYEPTPKQVTRLTEADVVFYIGDHFQPNVERALAAVGDDLASVDLLDGLTRIDDDPHVWLSIDNMRTITEEVRADLTVRSPALAEVFAANAATFDATLAALHDDYTVGLAHCASTYLVTGHRSFAYLAGDYGLTQIGIAGISPGDEPSAQDLADIADTVEQHGVHTIFFEEHLPTDLARTVADETGATTSMLNNAETLSTEQLDAGDDYVTIMRANLTALEEGLQCT